jgi:hypothetical protein
MCRLTSSSNCGDLFLRMNQDDLGILFRCEVQRILQRGLCTGGKSYATTNFLKLANTSVESVGIGEVIVAITKSFNRDLLKILIRILHWL